MSLMHAILGFLNTSGSLTGYDLKTECFDESVNHFWHADQAQIYRTLDKLVERGFAESHIEIQTDKPNRNVYQITEAGRAELNAWLRAFQEPPAHREPFLVQLFFADELPNDVILALLQQQLEAHQEVLTTYQHIEIPDPDTLPDPVWKRRIPLRRLTLDMGLQMEQMYIDWLRASMEIVKNLAD